MASRQPAVQTEVAPGKTLSASERKALFDLVNGDFDTLRLEISEYVGQLKATKEKEINAAHAEVVAEANKVKKEWEAFVAATNKKFQEFKRTHQDNGVAVQWPAYDKQISYPNPIIGVPKLQTEINLAFSAIDKDEQRALSALERKRIEAKRQILLACVTSEAGLELLNNIPTARDLMKSVALTTATKELIK